MENMKQELLDEELNEVNGGVVARKEEFAARGSNGVIMITSDQSMSALNEVDRKIRLDRETRFDAEAKNIHGKKAIIAGAVSSVVADDIRGRYPGK